MNATDCSISNLTTDTASTRLQIHMQSTYEDNPGGRGRADLLAALDGLLGFPLTPFSEGGELSLAAVRSQVERLVSFGVTALFPACGTGEMQSLTSSEYRAVVEACVDEAADRVPVFAGVGFGFGQAVEMTLAATAAGADGVLVFPPYTAPGGGQQAVAYYLELASRAPTNHLIYQRDAIVFTPSQVAELAADRNILGIKDGLGRVDLLRQQMDVIDRSSFAIVNGTPTAELFAPAMATCGIFGYSSALLNVMPELAVEFNRAFRADDVTVVERIMSEAVLPFVEIRDRVPGYNVALVKAGARLRGLDVGWVRSPLTDPTPADVEDLRQLLVRLGLDVHPTESARSMLAVGS